MQGICKICEKKFEVSKRQEYAVFAGKFVYCSSECRDQVAKIQNKEWTASHRQSVVPTMKIVSCSNSMCGKSFSPSVEQKRATILGESIFCSQECSARWYSERVLSFKNSNIEFKSCILCGALGLSEATSNFPGGGVSSDGLCRLCEAEIAHNTEFRAQYKRKLAKLRFVATF